MFISGLQKLTLLDFPNHVACTIFLKGCNYRCPYCQNKDLVNPEIKIPEIKKDEVLDFLRKRKGVLDGVCITGGEPTLHSDLEDFIKEIKKIGLKVKLDTNGYKPDVLKKLVNDKLIDYVAMDVKNSYKNYALTVGLNFIDIEKIKESIEFLIQGNVEYEFRTTVVKEYHKSDDFIEISTMLRGCSKYYLQNFEDSDTCLKRGLHPCSDEEMHSFLKILKDRGVNAYIRGEY